MAIIFLGSWFAQSVTGWTDFNADQADHSGDRVSWWTYVGSPSFWESTLQNWQSEFLAVGSFAILAVYLRQRGSPESKPVGESHEATGVEGDPGRELAEIPVASAYRQGPGTSGAVAAATPRRREPASSPRQRPVGVRAVALELADHRADDLRRVVLAHLSLGHDPRRDQAQADRAAAVPAGVLGVLRRPYSGRGAATRSSKLSTSRVSTSKFSSWSRSSGTPERWATMKFQVGTSTNSPHQLEEM